MHSRLAALDAAFAGIDHRHCVRGKRQAELVIASMRVVDDENGTAAQAAVEYLVTDIIGDAGHAASTIGLRPRLPPPGFSGGGSYRSSRS